MPPCGRPRRFPPEQIAQVKAIACELPRSEGVPLSRFSRAELHRLVIERGVCEASASTIARWLAEDALKPWQHRSWIFPTDPAFLEKAGPVLDLYQGRWQGKLLHPGEFVICADEKPSIQARARIHATLPPAPRSRGQRVEHTYQRGGALTYLAALDIGRRGGRRPRVFGRSEPSGGIAPFDRLVWQVMTKQPYASARRVFWIVDNGSSHRGQKSVERLERRWPNLVLVHLPVHASWLNQIEIYYSIVQRKLLEPNDFDDLADARSHPQRLRAPLERDRRALRLELHPRRPRRADRPPDNPRAPTPARRMTTSELTTGSTSSTLVAVEQPQDDQPVVRSFGWTSAWATRMYYVWHAPLEEMLERFGDRTDSRRSARVGGVLIKLVNRLLLARAYAHGRARPCNERSCFSLAGQVPWQRQPEPPWWTIARPLRLSRARHRYSVRGLTISDDSTEMFSRECRRAAWKRFCGPRHSHQR